MITETGRVVVVESNCLWVETIRKSACDSCRAQKGCGQGLAAKLGGHSSFIRVLLLGRDPAGYQVDDEITIGIPNQVVANSSLRVYLTPLVTMLMGIWAASGSGLSELLTIVSAVVGFAVGAGLVRWHANRHRDDPDLQPVLVDSPIG